MISGTLKSFDRQSVRLQGDNPDDPKTDKLFELTDDFKVVRGEEQEDPVTGRVAYPAATYEDLKKGAEVVLHGPPKAEKVHAIRIL